MQVPGPFEYERATSVEHAVGLLDRLGEEARIVAGGHSLLPMMKLRLANPEYLIDINDLTDELGTFAVEPTRVRLGAMAAPPADPRLRRPRRGLPDLPRRRTGDRRSGRAQPRHHRRLAVPGRPRRGPHHRLLRPRRDAAWSAGPNGTREIGIDDFLRGPYETALAPNEMLTEVIVPLRPHASSAYEKVERRAGDWAVAAAGAAVALDGDTITHARIGLTAVVPDRAAVAAIGEFLAGKPATEETYVEAGRMAAQACDPPTDMRGSTEYKRHLASELTIRTLRRAVDARARLNPGDRP